MSHDHSPEDDIPCTACETEGSRSRLDEDGLCPDCRTPAGRLVTALGLLGIKAEANDEETVTAAGFIGAMIDGDNEWTLYRVGADLEAADAIAAIVQAPGLRAELTDIREVLTGGEPGSLTDAVHWVVTDRIALIEQARTLTAERDTLAARVAALEAHNGRMAAAWLKVASACDAAYAAFGSKWGENGGAESVACFLPGETWAKTGDAIRDLAGGAS